MCGQGRKFFSAGAIRFGQKPLNRRDFGPRFCAVCILQHGVGGRVCLLELRVCVRSCFRFDVCVSYGKTHAYTLHVCVSYSPTCVCENESVGNS